jgi:S1-C subfamily serine protease
MDGKPVKDYNANQELLKTKKRGKEAVFTVKRADKEIKLTLKLGTWLKK